MVPQEGLHKTAEDLYVYLSSEFSPKLWEYF